MKNIKPGYFIAFLLSVLFFLSCAPGNRLNTIGVTEAEISGAYRVILFGCNYLNDLETIVLLDKEDDQYTLEPYAPDFSYRAVKGAAAKDALEMADKFLNCNLSFSHSQLRSIRGLNEEIIGYEIRPLYDPLAYGVDDVLETDYRLKGDKVVIKINLIQSIEDRLRWQLEE